MSLGGCQESGGHFEGGNVDLTNNAVSVVDYGHMHDNYYNGFTMVSLERSGSFCR